MIDTHCHLTYEGLYDRVDDVISTAADAGVDRMITVGTTPDDIATACELAERFDNVFATVGLHPHYADEYRNRTSLIEVMRRFGQHDRFVALGEMGRDRHYPDPPIEAQKRALEWQLEVALEFPKLPIIIHNREATDETLEILRSSQVPAERFVFHCFTGTSDELDAILAFGAMVSFTGIVTFKSARDLAECAARVPEERLMVETDSPYLTPEPHRKVRPNEPCYVADVARFLAQKRGVDFDAFVEAMDLNAERFFGLSSNS